MQIVIEPVSLNRYRGILLLDGQVENTTIQPRPGCCVRNLLNSLMLKHGAPDGTITIEIDGW